MVIDDEYPIWFNAAKAVGINVLSVWLLSDDVFPLSYISSFTRDVPICCGPKVCELTMNHLKACKWIFIGGRITNHILSTGLFEELSIKFILFTKGLNRSSPPGWYLSEHKISHSEVGGVTDGSHSIFVLSRDPMSGGLTMEATPLQDLRSILKTGEMGQLDLSMMLPASKEASTVVKFYGQNRIEESSLYPTRNATVRVRTQWRGHLWVLRELNMFEKLLSFDVPEKLIRMVPEGMERVRLLNLNQLPNKVLFAFLSAMDSTNRVARTGYKRQADVAHTADISIKRQKVEKSYDDNLKLNINVNVERRMEYLTVIPEERECEVLDHDPVSFDLDQNHNLKATKSDSAEVRTELWNKHLLQGLDTIIQGRCILDAVLKLRQWFLRIWKRRLTLSFIRWAKVNRVDEHHDQKTIYNDARDCLTRAANASWWAWDSGSRPFFWRWPSDYIDTVRNGSTVWIDGQVKPWRNKQRGVADKVRRGLIKEKLDTIRSKGYVEFGTIISLMSFFDVPKGTDDIRMVYDGSASGLNGYLWSPWFGLPTYECLLRALEPGYSMADNDVGEMFHNFMVHKDLRKYCGMDMTLFSSPSQRENKGKRVWMRWNRLAMGLRPSPYCAVQGMMIAREVILGDKHNEKNVFRWETVALNLPGSKSYSPSKAWYTKVRRDGSVAADVFIYVDDIRCSAPTQLEAWTASQRTSSVLGFLGLQDAARKRRDPGQETGAWTGSVVWTSNNQISIMTTQEKWDKTKSNLQWIHENIENKEGLDNKRLQSIRGFLVYVSRTYTSLVPYLKGLHATIDSWRFGRTATGWKIGSKKVKIELEQQSELLSDWDERFGLTPLSETEPTHVKPVPRFRNDLKCLMTLTASATPPHRMGRMQTQARVMYGFGDASKHGFGASIELPDKSIFWRFGQWRLEEEEKDKRYPTLGLSLIEERSSNYRELRNLVEALESSFAQGMLSNRELFMFTDNSTAEAAFFKGTSTSELLFDLVLRLRKIEMTGQCIIHMVHVAGTRMIHQGTDGLSRGDKTTGVMAGESMLSFVPLHLSALERSPQLHDWITEVCSWEDQGSDGVEILNASDWPTILNKAITYIWFPPPTIADVAADYMAQAIHKRSNATHIFICPRLMTARWTRIIRKTTDLFFAVPIGSSLWGTGHGNMEAPLIANTLEKFCQVCFVRIYPEQALCCANALYVRGGWGKCDGYWCHGCYKIEDDNYFPIRRPKDEDGYVVIVPKDRNRFLFGRAGDHLVTTFQCDLCHFRNINNRTPRMDGQDALLLRFIRRANLDALWSREPGTVNNTRRDIDILTTKAKQLGIKVNSIMPCMGPFPVKDSHGMAIAVCILLRSLDAGRNEETIQFSTATKMKSSYANVWRASLEGSQGAVVSRDTTKMYHTTCPTHGDWFERFSKGMHERMGDLVKPDLAISIEQMHALMGNYEKRWVQAGSSIPAQETVIFPALFCVIAFCCGLRGEELPLLSLCGIRRHLERGKNHPTHPHVVVALLGRFKSEVSQKYHLMPVVLTTATGLEPGIWINRMVKWYEQKGITRGWVFRNAKDGEAARASTYEWDILMELEKIQKESPDIIDEKVNVLEEYGVSRSFRRGSDTHAQNQGVSISDIERNNRWRSVEHAGSKKVVLRMVHHYEEVSQMLKSLLRYSGPL